MRVCDVICQAIEKRRLLEFVYGGRWRVVVPYCHGSNRLGMETLRAVQVGGSSTSGGFGFGKLWTVSEMSNLQATEEAFVPDDPDYNPNDSAMARIHCRV